MTTFKNGLYRQNGFSFIEVLIALSILTLSVLASTKIISHSLTNLYRQQQIHYADQFAMHINTLIDILTITPNSISKSLPVSPMPCKNLKQMSKLPVCLPDFMLPFLKNLNIRYKSITDKVINMQLHITDNLSREYLLILNQPVKS